LPLRILASVGRASCFALTLKAKCV